MVEMEGPEPVSFRARRFYRFQKEEVKHLLVSILVVAFIFGYNDGQSSFNLAYWISNFVIILIIVATAFLVHVSAQKIAALRVGYICEYRMWITGLVASIIFTFLTNGSDKWYLILPGGIFIQHMAIQRLGKFRYGLNIKSMGLIAAAGSMANLLVVTFAFMMSKQLHIFPAFFDLVAKINFLLLIFMLLPLPNMPGLHLFYASRLTYVFIFCTVTAYYVLSTFGILSWIISFIIGVICWFLFYIFFERKVG